MSTLGRLPGREVVHIQHLPIGHRELPKAAIGGAGHESAASIDKGYRTHH